MNSDSWINNIKTDQKNMPFKLSTYLLNVICKMFAVLLRRTKYYIGYIFANQQACFRISDSHTNQVLRLQFLAEKYKHGSVLYAAYIDF